MKDSSDKFRKLDVSCWAKEPRTDDLLGQAKVDITETLRTGEFDGTRCTIWLSRTPNLIPYHQIGSNSKSTVSTEARFISR
jgi:hypothetical protein